MNNYGNLCDNELTDWLINKAGFIQSQFQLSIYYNYAPYGTDIVVLSYVDDCVYWYASEALGKKFLDSIGQRFRVKFLGYSHWFMSIRISQTNCHYI